MGNSLTRAKNKYNAKAYERISLFVKTGEKEIIKAAAERRGESVNAFINRSIAAALKADEKTAND